MRRRRGKGKSRGKGRGKRRGKRMGKRRGGKGKSVVMSALREMKKLSTPMPYNYAYAYRIAAAAGTRCVSALCVVNDSVDLVIMHTRMQLSLGYSSTTVINKFATGEFRGDYTIKSACTDDQFVQVFRCVARRDLDTTQAPLIAYNGYPTLVNFADAITSMLDGFNEQGLTGLTRTNFTYGLNIFDSNKFTALWKIRGSKRYKIRGGGVIKVPIRSKRWHMWNGTRINGIGGSTDTATTCFRGVTEFFFMVVSADPVNDTTNTNNVTAGPISLLIMAEESYKFTAMANSHVNTIAPTVSFGVVTTASTINERTDAIITPATS